MKSLLVKLLIALSIAFGGLGISQFTSQPVGAMSQVILGGFVDNLNSGTTEYNSVNSGSSWTSTAASRKNTISTSGTISRLSIKLSADPGTNPDAYCFTIMLNGSATALTVTITADNTTGIDEAHTVDVVAGDYINIRSEAVNTPSATPTARWSIIFEGDTANESLIIGSGSCMVGSTQYYPISNGSIGITNVTANKAYQIIPTSGYIKNLYVVMTADPGTNPDAYRYTLFKNGSSAGCPTVTITADNKTGNSGATSIEVSAGDYVYIEVAPLNSPSAYTEAYWGFTFLSSVDGESIILGQSSSSPSFTSTSYHYPVSSAISTAWSTSTSQFQGGQAPTGDMVLKYLYVMQSSASGAGGSGDKWNYTIRGGGGDTGITCEILETATTSNDTVHTYTCTSYDDLDIKAVPTSTPTASMVYWGLVCYISSGATYDITIDTSSKAFGVVDVNTTYYAKGSAPNNPVQDGDCTFIITNTGSAAIDIDAHIDDFTGGVGWNISNSPGSNEVKVTLYYTGQNPASGLVLTNADQEFYDNLAAGGHIHVDFSLLTGSGFTDGTGKTTTLTFTSRAHS